MKTFKELIEKRIFRIPDYQRGYSWEKKQVDELIEDIENIRLLPEENSTYHFTGILSFSKIEKDSFTQKEKFEINEEIELYHVTDGQQRLTTIFIILFEIYKRLEITNDLNKILICDENNNSMYRFGYDVDVPSREYLYGEIFENEDYKDEITATVYTNNLDEVKNSINDYLENLDIRDIKIFKRKIEQRLLFQEFILDTDKLDVSMVFETMNYRGKNLSKLELFKNRLIYLIGSNHPRNYIDLKSQVIYTWLTLYKWLGKTSEVKLNDDVFLSSFAIIFFDNNNSTDGEFKKITDRIFNKEYPIKSNIINDNLSVNRLDELSQTLIKSVKIFYFINNPFAEDIELDEFNISNRLRKQIFVINSIGGASYIKTLICSILIKYFLDNEKNEPELLELLIEIEKHQMIVFNLLGRKVDANRPKILLLCYQIFSNTINFNTAKIEILKLIEKWWDDAKYIDFIQDKLNSLKNRFHDINGIKTLLYLKELDAPGLEKEIKNLHNYSLDTVFPPKSQGRKVKFPNVCKNRTPVSIEYLFSSLGNIIIIEKNNRDNNNVNGQNYINARSNQLNNSSIQKVREISTQLVGWSDNNIESRGIEILTFMKERYKLRNFEVDQMRRILNDNLIIV
jgi:uncharacterized protein with ParB-like and HNH nuclease domain